MVLDKNIDRRNPYMVALREKRGEIIRAAQGKTRNPDVAGDILEELSNHGKQLRAKYGDVRVLDTRAYHFLMGGTGLQATADDFEGEDAVALFLDNLLNKYAAQN